MVIATVVLRPQTESPFWEYIKEHTAQQLVAAYETAGAPALNAQIDQLHKTFKFQAYLFDDQGKELAGTQRPRMGPATQSRTRASIGMDAALLVASFCDP